MRTLATISLIWLLGGCGDSSADGGICGYYSNQTAEIGVVLDSNCGPVPPILGHEIGHAFGLKHSTDVNSVMYPHARNWLTRQEVAEQIVAMIKPNTAMLLEPSPAMWDETVAMIEAVNEAEGWPVMRLGLGVWVIQTRSAQPTKSAQ